MTLLLPSTGTLLFSENQRELTGVEKQSLETFGGIIFFSGVLAVVLCCAYIYGKLICGQGIKCKI